MKFNFMKKFKGFRNNGNNNLLRSSVHSTDSLNPSIIGDAYFNQSEDGVPQVIPVDEYGNPSENFNNHDVLYSYDFKSDLKNVKQRRNSMYSERDIGEPIEIIDKNHKINNSLVDNEELKKVY